ncbi:unnamed protein product [Rangifer tarandus platyrhynchus]|uniref:Uncharacterized protein n=1 Tax=Rangifer tarandus platyrhynchus TaxID=3082113 RepID=A0ABN8XKM0_RANTA|nr:unnamed protein product [Rangifer tarandus platyrhynchus]
MDTRSCIPEVWGAFRSTEDIRSRISEVVAELHSREVACHSHSVDARQRHSPDARKHHRLDAHRCSTVGHHSLVTRRRSICHPLLAPRHSGITDRCCRHSSEGRDSKTSEIPRCHQDTSSWFIADAAPRHQGHPAAFLRNHSTGYRPRQHHSSSREAHSSSPETHSSSLETHSSRPEAQSSSAAAAARLHSNS